MYTVYILKSKNRRKFYTGKTNNLELRMREHNTGKSKYTKRYIPWIVVYSEDCFTEKAAIKKEKYLKSAAGRRWLKENIGL